MSPERNVAGNLKAGISMGKINLLAIDIGNSACTYAIWVAGRLRRNGHVKTNGIPRLTVDLAKWGVTNDRYKVIISSVVPDITRNLLKSISSHLPRKSVYVVGQDVHPHVPMKYKRKALGSDRLVNLYGALRFYKPPVLIVDFGTAITFDCLSRSGIFEGGLIVPGVQISWEALVENTALLPRINRFKPMKGWIGRETKSAMNLGILNGFGALSDGLIEGFRKRFGRNITVIATGGLSTLMASYVRGFDRVDPLHTLRSLALIFRNQIANKSVP